jgi:hypothetical protein
MALCAAAFFPSSGLIPWSFAPAGLPGYFQGIRTKIVQSVLAASLLFMCKEKITDLTRGVLAGAAQDNRVQLP